MGRRKLRKKILENQFGFQKGKSTVDCIFTFYSIIAKTLGSKEKNILCFIDYEKAFDKVDRSFLWQKLILEQVSAKLAKAQNAMCSVVKSYVRYRSDHSHVSIRTFDTVQVQADSNDIFTEDDMQLFLLMYCDAAVVFAKSTEVFRRSLTISLLT